MKNKYLTLYDYDTGGVWCYIYAHNENDIKAKYPELKVLENEPNWFAELNREIASKNTFDIDDEPKYFLAALVQGRSIE